MLPAELPPDYAVMAAENTKRAFRKWEAGGEKEEIVLY